MKLLLILANLTSACWDLGLTTFSLLKCILNSVNKQQHRRGEQWGQKSKATFLVTNSPISMHRIAAISKDSKFPNFVYLNSKMQLEEWSSIALNAHSAPVIKGQLSPVHSSSHANLVAMSRGLSHVSLFSIKLAILVRDFSIAGFERDLIKIKNEIYTTSFSVADTTCHDCFETQKCRLYLPFFGQLNSFKCCNYCILMKVSFLLLSSVKTDQKKETYKSFPS